MNTNVRRIAVGAALVLCATSAPVVAMAAPAAVAAPVTTTLDGRQAKAAFVQARATATEQALRRGARVVHTDEDVDKSDDWIKYRWTVKIDAKRHTLRRSEKVDGDYAVPAIGYMDACGGVDPDDVWDVAKAKVGRWDDLQRGETSPDALRMAGKPKARWTKVVDRRTTMRTLVARSIKGTSYGQDDRFAGARFDAGTRTATPTGATYALTFRHANGVPGRLTMSTDGRGALVRLRAELPDAIFTDSSVVNTWVTYGKQRVVAPTAKSRWIDPTDRVLACETVDLVRTGVRPLARSIANTANWGEGPTTVKDIRDAANGHGTSSIVRITKIRGGVKIVGSSKFLPYDFVATVFVRSGTAVINNIR